MQQDASSGNGAPNAGNDGNKVAVPKAGCSAVMSPVSFDQLQATGGAQRGIFVRGAFVK